MPRLAVTFLDIVCTTLVVVFFLVFIAWFTVPRFLGWHPQVVLSGSMEPALKTGAVAFVEPKSADAVKLGDILTFKRPDRPTILVTHRVVEIEKTTEGLFFKTKGDANDTGDNWEVPAANVVGTVKYSIPYLGYVTDKVRTRGGFFLLVCLPAVLIVFGEMQSILRESKKKRREEQEA